MATNYNPQVTQQAIYPPLLLRGQPQYGPKGGLQRIKVTIGKATLTCPVTGQQTQITCVKRKGAFVFGITRPPTGTQGPAWCPGNGKPHTRPAAYPLPGGKPAKAAHSSLSQRQFLAWATVKLGGAVARQLVQQLTAR